MSKVYRTPGVYIEEISNVSASISAVPTAVPAFIGYTEKAERKKKDITNKPLKIDSFAEYMQFFGGPPSTEFEVLLHDKDKPKQKEIKEGEYKLEMVENTHYHLYYSMKLYYDNGGGKCYIVSVGKYDKAKGIDKEEMKKGIDSLQKEQEPTMVVVPDAVLLKEGSECYNVQNYMLKHCGQDMRSRVSILDIYKGYLDRTDDFDLAVEDKEEHENDNDVILRFRNQMADDLDFGAAYYPWLKSSIVSRKDVNLDHIKDKEQLIKLLAFHAERDLRGAKKTKTLEEIYKLRLLDKYAYKSVNGKSTFEEDLTTAKAALKTAKTGWKERIIQAAKDQIETDVKEIKDQISGLDYETNKEAIDKVNAAIKLIQKGIEPLSKGKFLDKIDEIKTDEIKDIGTVTTGIGDIKTRIDDNLKAVKKYEFDLSEPVAEETDENKQFLDKVIAAEKNAKLSYAQIKKIVDTYPDDGKNSDKIKGLKEFLNASETLKEDKSHLKEAINNILKGAEKYKGAADIKKFNANDELKISDLEGALAEIDITKSGMLSTLKTVSPVFKELLNSIRGELNLLPPSGAMAGVYARVDLTEGVQQSPANVGLRSVIAPALKITAGDQEDLNVPFNGKSVNAIRTFTGKGTLVWGARTLDGNNDDWRYMSVRRSVIMIEQSIKLALSAYVFRPNNQSTWLDIEAKITAFLTTMWNNGVLVGATPSEAFTVTVGLGTTMTPKDILEGYMRISIGLCVVRPAEFIVVTFSQMVQGAGA